MNISSNSSMVPSQQLQLQEAARLNLLGTASLSKQRFRVALNLFKKALAIVESISKSPLQSIEGDRVHILPAETMEGLQDERYFVYNRALHFYPNIDGGVTEHRVFFYSAVIVFNIALAFHCPGMKKMDNRSLSAAKAFYGKSLLIIDAVASNSVEYNMLKLFVLNNECQIHLDECNIQEFWTCLNEVRTLSFSLTGPLQEIHSDNLLGNLLLNALVSRPATIAPCA